jgi:hypothetical protein
MLLENGEERLHLPFAHHENYFPHSSSRPQFFLFPVSPDIQITIDSLGIQSGTKDSPRPFTSSLFSVVQKLGSSLGVAWVYMNSVTYRFKSDTMRIFAKESWKFR